MISLSSYTKYLWIGDYGLKNILQDGVIEVYAGSRPVDADAAATGTLLGLVTQDGATFTAGSRTAGALRITTSGYGVLSNSGNWRLTVGTAGTATWFRYHGNYADANLADTGKVHIRLDGDAGLNGELYLADPVLAEGVVPVTFFLQLRNI